MFMRFLRSSSQSRFLEALLTREVLGDITFGNKKSPYAGLSFALRALWRTRTADTLLTMEDSRCGRG
jgi:hypothetical protein